MITRNRKLALFLILTILTSCIPISETSLPSPSSTSKPLSSSTVTSTLPPLSIYYEPEVPDLLISESKSWKIPLEPDPLRASLHIGSISSGENTTPIARSTWIYALVAPFPTVEDEVTLDELKSSWHTTSSEIFAGSPLWMTESTLATFTKLWGAPSITAIKTVPSEDLIDALWKNQPSWGIVPFEDLKPRLKVIAVDGQSPIHNKFDVSDYPLKAEFALRVIDRNPDSISLKLLNSNREPDHMTTLILTGVTALVRATAYMMETKGVTYPGRDIGSILRQADITHISNEIPFFTGCDFPNPSRSKLIFCSDPKYIELLNDVGTDVVELTGNHFADYGPGAMLETLEIYNQNDISYYGGGKDLEDARKPLLIEHNGNRFAFIGCNPVDLGRPPVATPLKPGAAPCSHKYLVDTIEKLIAQDYFVIATFQHQEYYSPEPRIGQLKDFHLVADAGAAIVSGSQAHYAQVMEFYNDSFIHYGLGNLFFDQMGEIPYHPGIRREFIDRYVVYNGNLISVELITTMLVDYARPRLMTPGERASFLNEYFHHSGWSEIIPSPAPPPTVTLTPMTLPYPFTTITPEP